MSLVFINRICKHNRITLASTKHSPGALQIIGFPRSFRLVSTAINKDNLKTDFFVVLNNGQRGILRGNPKGGWYSIAVQDEHTGIETIRKLRGSEFSTVGIDEKEHMKNIAYPSDTMGNSYLNALQASVSNNEKVKSLAKQVVDLPVIIPPQAHQDCKNWVIFSDLHVKSASIDVCEEVLHQVHQAAVDRNAGVVFLGDFWHVRGSLSVELLNRVLKALGKWTQPVIMIPGNHDQVTLGGKVHSLEPLVYAFQPEQILMINEPSVCLGALWVPYRRDPTVLRAVLRAGAARQDVSMVFCHADVKGAYMNDNMRSKEGIDITDFPKNLPIFSGHFHKPHTISKQSSTLRYVGSPYQTSLSEAGQDKFFYLVGRVDRETAAAEEEEGKAGVGMGAGAMQKHHQELLHAEARLGVASEGEAQPAEAVWKEIERWTVSIGSKIIKASSPADPSVLAAKAGDRVVVTVPVGQDYAAQKLLAELEERGVEVDLQYEHSPLTRRRAAAATGRTAMEKVDGNAFEGCTVSPSFDPEGGVIDPTISTSKVGAVKVEDMDPLRIFDTYMSQLSTNTTIETSSAASATLSSGADGGLTDEKIQAAVLEEGRRTIDRLLGSAGADGNALGDRVSVTGAGNGARVKDLRLENVSLSNFGPYGGDKAVQYPLSSRGLVLIRGQSTDGTGADSNGAGKTTLAMSVMWGLTGSLDARMVGDSKSADVTYDAVLSRTGNGGTEAGGTTKKKASAAKESKLTAEVTVQGLINSVPFEIVRRRSSKKAELHFRMDGRELTTQAVKDTQALIDEHLGIQSGLLQRCCFFGQHTHTMQSLLGLTDVKLKQELSALVDTSLWVTASQDVRARERGIRSKLQELAVEARLRKEECGRAESAANSANATLNSLQAELESAQRLAQELPMANVSIVDLTAKLSETQQEMDSFATREFEPLKSSARELAIRRESALSEIDSAVNALKVRVAKCQTERNSAISTAGVQQKKLEQIMTQEANSGKLVDQMTRNITTLSGNSEVSFDPEELRQAYELSLSELTAVNLRIDGTRTSLERLRELEMTVLEATSTPSSSSAHQHVHTSTDEECPTCGQEMPLESREKRTAALESALKALLHEKEDVTKNSAQQRKIYDCAVARQTSIEQLKGLQSRSFDLKIELESLQNVRQARSDELAVLEDDLTQHTERRASIATEFVDAERTQTEKFKEAERRMETLTGLERTIRFQIDDLRMQQEKLTTRKRSADAQVALAQDRVTSAFKALQERTAGLEKLRAVIAENDVVAEDITRQGIVLERLVSVLGARGIQNFVFQNVIAQLESITNAYLMVLAEGGIQLALQGDGEDEDRIVKSVWVRSRDSQGEYRERNLAQLSGGQWRRVSLALDFAFAELIRRRGVLRCNLMVMDEVLTHLDASGRESVGTVLRAMVQGPSLNNSTTTSLNIAGGDEDGVDEYGVALPNAEEMKMQQLAGALLGGGAYETVIVILQDLAAAELSEAFDHVDVVVKEADSSVVILDGADA